MEKVGERLVPESGIRSTTNNWRTGKEAISLTGDILWQVEKIVKLNDKAVLQTVRNIRSVPARFQNVAAVVTREHAVGNVLASAALSNPLLGFYPNQLHACV